MSVRNFAALCAVLTIFAAMPALAQSAPAPGASPSPSPLPEIGRTQTADRRDEPLRDAVKSTYVVTKAEMVRRGDVTVADALASVPGVNVQRNGPLGTIAEVTIDGYRTVQILVLIDGRPAGAEEIEFSDILLTMPTTGVQRIEVVEGGGATLYGTGAMGGVINIITDGANRDLLRRPRVSLDKDSLGGGGFSFENGMFSFERRYEANSYAFPAIGPVPAGTTVNEDYSSTGARFNTRGRVGALGVAFNAGLRSDHIGDPGDYAFPPVATTARENTTSGDARLSLSLDRARSTTTLDLSGTTLRSVFTFLTSDPAFVAFNLFGGTTQLSTEGRAQLSVRDVVRSDGSTLVVGIDLAHGAGRVDDGVTPSSLGFAQTAAYVQESLGAQNGARLDLGLRGERDGAYGGVVAPSIGTRIPLIAGLALRANYATSFRAPDITDLIFPTFSNPNLRPERSHGGDLALDAPGLLGGASLRWFTENGNDLIATNPNYDFGAPTSPTNPFLINVAKFSIAGFVGTVRTRAYHGVSSSISITDTYRALDLTTTASRLARRPVIGANVALEYANPAPSWFDSFGLLANAVGPHDTPDTEFTRVDGYLRFRITRGALLSLRVFDVGNERYADVSGFPTPGRTFSLEISTR
jgi:vitamin B12 transporter